MNVHSGTYKLLSQENLYIVGEILFGVLPLIIRGKETRNHLEKSLKIFHEQHLSFK